MKYRPLMFSVKLIFCLSIAVQTVNAQSDTTDKLCSAPEASQFDFWIGKWELAWTSIVLAGDQNSGVVKPSRSRVTNKQTIAKRDVPTLGGICHLAIWVVHH